MTVPCCLLQCPDELLCIIVNFTCVSQWSAVMRTCKRLCAVVRGMPPPVHVSTLRNALHYGLYGPLSVSFPAFVGAACGELGSRNMISTSRAEAATYVSDVSEQGCLTRNSCTVTVACKQGTMSLVHTVHSSWISPTGRSLTATRTRQIKERADLTAAVHRFGRVRVQDVLMCAMHPGSPFVLIAGIPAAIQALKGVGITLPVLIRFLARSSMFADAGHVRFDAPQYPALRDMYAVDGIGQHAPAVSIERPAIDIALALNNLGMLMYPVRAVQFHEFTRIVHVGETRRCARSYMVLHADTMHAGQLFVWITDAHVPSPSYRETVVKIAATLTGPSPDAMFSTVFKRVSDHAVSYAVSVLLRGLQWKYSAAPDID